MASYPFSDRSGSGSLTVATGVIEVRKAGGGVGAGDGAYSGGRTASGTGAGASPGAYPVAGGGGVVGGKVSSSRCTSVPRNKKRTPYDRPASGRHSAPGAAAASASSSGPSIASRLVDSASRLLSSSASYIFSSFFGRRTPALANGDAHIGGDVEPGQVQVQTEEQEQGQEKEDHVIQKDKIAPPPDVEPSLVANGTPRESRELNLAKVEGILQQQTWSREQVNRLTELLQTRVHEKSEAQRWREQLKKARDDSTPVEVARAYMGERTSKPSGLVGFHQGTARQVDRVAELQPPPGLGLIEDRYRPSPVLRMWARSPATGRIPARSSGLDDDWALVGPIRRTRQRALTLANSSPYARRMTGTSRHPQTMTSPPMQSSQTARKILDTLEKLTPSPKGKSSEGQKITMEMTPTDQTPNAWKVRETKLQELSEPGPSGSMIEPEIPVPGDSCTMRESVTCPPTLTPGSPAIIPERSKGFRMSAVFEESNSDEESQPNAKSPPLSEPELPVISSDAEGTLPFGAAATIKPSLASMPTTMLCTTAPDVTISVTRPLPINAQSSLSFSPLSTFDTVQSSGFSVVSLPLVSTSGIQGSCAGAVMPDQSENLVSSTPFPTSFSLAAKETIPTICSATTAAFAIPAASAASTLLEAGCASTASTAPSGASIPAAARVPVAAAPRAAPVSPVAAESLAAGALVEATPPIIATPGAAGAPVPATTAPVVVSLDTVTVIEDLPEAENGATMATEGPGADKLVEVDTMATDPMAEEPETFTVRSSTPVFQFGPSSTAPTSVSSGSTFSFVAGAMSTPVSSFSFSAQSAEAPPTSSVSFTFGGQSGASSGAKGFTFGSPASLPSVSPFSMSTAGNATPFSFGSVPSASTSAPASFPLASSAVSSFSGTSSALPSFQVTSSALSTFAFGARGTSSSSSSSSTSGQVFGFGAQLPPAAGSFPTTGAGNSSPAFAFVPSAASSATQAFSFGAGDSISLPSGSSFGGQPFGFGVQHTAPAANPFSSAVAPNAASAFLFASSSAASLMPFGSTAASSPSFAFGAQSTTPFTFGSQTGASLAGQPFAFGGQSTTPGASNAFSQPGLEFAGGFALGATGGEKSGRRYIKAKRTAGAKRGK